MSLPSKVYISLGSNQGDKFKNLQDAIDLIFTKIGKVNIISRVYKSPAFGFDGDEFLNTCICIETELNPKALLKGLIAIEKSLGRVRTKKNGYESRSIDLDIIFFEDEIVNIKKLTIPHPEMQNRKFVLLPLNDIASKIEHPIFKKEVLFYWKNVRIKVFYNL